MKLKSSARRLVCGRECCINRGVARRENENKGDIEREVTTTKGVGAIKKKVGAHRRKVDPAPGGFRVRDEFGGRASAIGINAPAPGRAIKHDRTRCCPQ